MKFLSKILLKLMGWKVIGGVAPDPKCIVLGAPHTSIWDFIVSRLFYTSLGGKAHVLVKKELFFWPLSYFVRAMGGIPVDRSRGAALAKQIIDEFNRRDSLHLAIAIEGTRRATSNWKAGFHTIASATGIPVYTGFFDWGKKEVGIGEKITLSDNAQNDIIRIKQWYTRKGVKGKYPNMFITGLKNYTSNGLDN